MLCSAVSAASLDEADTLAKSNGNGISPLSLISQDSQAAYNLEVNDWSVSSLSVVVLGASGDLAKKKIFPALFALYYEGLLPQVSCREAPLCVVIVLRSPRSPLRWSLLVAGGLRQGGQHAPRGASDAMC